MENLYGFHLRNYVQVSFLVHSCTLNLSFAVAFGCANCDTIYDRRRYIVPTFRRTITKTILNASMQN